MNDRPIVEISVSTTDVVVEVIAGIALAALWVYTAAVMPSLPDRIATHFGATGVPDGWGPKSSLWGMPGVGTASYIALTVLNRFPHIFNYPVRITQENAARQYALAVSALRWLKMEIVLLCGGGVWQTVRVARSEATALEAWFTPVMLAALTATAVALIVRSLRAR